MKKYFYVVCAILALFVLYLFVRYLSSPDVFNGYDRKTFFEFLAIVIGISLLPFISKLKIGSFIELERIRQEVEEVKINQYLGEVIKNSKGDLFYYDEEGKHPLPDVQTANFLKSRKGELLVHEGELKK